MVSEINEEKFEPYCIWRRNCKGPKPNEEEYAEVEMHLHGFKKDEYRIKPKGKTLTGGKTLTVSGEHSVDANTKNVFERVFELERVLDGNKFTHKFSGGILHIKIPKKRSFSTLVRSSMKKLQLIGHHMIPSEDTFEMFWKFVQFVQFVAVVALAFFILKYLPNFCNNVKKLIKC
ncbi:hypothetical protein Pint_20069 [Pistacia integerrima]|uniref:Uncharacterized protein n=1 Tax=Pistacia integerrima TaxID=434235 RepID=A0ACC0X9M4_9ROSI|nr:hypothetical protein Pint_20069 [Pistacia integerrima]